jgi:hypothetical protein
MISTIGVLPFFALPASGWIEVEEADLCLRSSARDSEVKRVQGSWPVEGGERQRKEEERQREGAGYGEKVWRKNRGGIDEEETNRK